MKPTTISAALFKAECLGLLDKVARTKQSIVITKRGRPVARLMPLQEPTRSLAGSIVLEHDIVSPIDVKWNAR